MEINKENSTATTVCPACQYEVRNTEQHNETGCKAVQEAKKHYDKTADEITLVYVGSQALHRWISENDGVKYGDRSIKYELNKAVRETMIGNQQAEPREKGYIEDRHYVEQTRQYLIVENNQGQSFIYQKNEPGYTQNRSFACYHNRELFDASVPSSQVSTINNLARADLPEELLFTDTDDPFAQQVNDIGQVPEPIRATYVATTI